MLPNRLSDNADWERYTPARTKAELSDFRDVLRMTCQESGGDSRCNAWVREDESLGLRVVRRDRHTQVVAVVFRRRIGQLYGYHVITVFCTATDPDA